MKVNDDMFREAAHHPFKTIKKCRYLKQIIKKIPDLPPKQINTLVDRRETARYIR